MMMMMMMMMMERFGTSSPALRYYSTERHPADLWFGASYKPVFRVRVWGTVAGGRLPFTQPASSNSTIIPSCWVCVPNSSLVWNLMVWSVPSSH